LVLADEAIKGGLGDPFRVQQSVLDTEAIDRSLVGSLVVEVRLGGVDRFEQFLGGDLASLPFVAAGLWCHAGNAVVLVAVKPGLDGPPGELTGVAFLVEEGQGGDLVNAFVAGSAGGGIDGPQHAHLQIDRWLLHESSPDGTAIFGRTVIEAEADGSHDDILRCR
jgi:hypothetical protein